MAIEYPGSIIIDHPGGTIEGSISLNRSKSISNRVLLIRALSPADFPIHHLSDSDDTQTMLRYLSPEFHGTVYDAHHAGTTFRFLCAWLSTRPGTQELTGSARMKERPIKALVDALRSIGADITYLEKEGYPPLKIGPPPAEWGSTLSLPADISSQYISALMMIAPSLSNGLEINLEGDAVSIPYIEMTASLMRYFGVGVVWNEQKISIAPSAYTSREFTVEADWSAASYYYSIAALAKKSTIHIKGLLRKSTQGDSKVAMLMEQFGIETKYLEDGIVIEKKYSATDFFEYDFLYQPDLAQTFAVLCGALGTQAIFTGLQTLRIKETDRIQALKVEMAKYGVFLSKVPPHMVEDKNKEYYMQEGLASPDQEARIQTYHDHRMAMAFAPLSLKFPITIDDPGVVSKSYPSFWQDLSSLGFRIG